MPRSRWPMFDFYRGLSGLAMDSSAVIGLRMMKAAQGGASWPAEARLMVAEKAQAAMDAQTLFMRGLLSGGVAGAPSQTLAMYRRRVKANRRRLSGNR